MFKRIAISLGITSVAALAVYTIKVHYDVRVVFKACNELALIIEQEQIDEQFAEIVEGLDDIDI